MGLVEKLEREAKVIEPWSGYEYVQVRADLRELLEKAAKYIRKLEVRAYGAPQIDGGKYDR